MMLDWLGDRHGDRNLTGPGLLIETAVNQEFAANRVRPMEIGGDQGTDEITGAIVDVIAEASHHAAAAFDDTAETFGRVALGLSANSPLLKREAPKTIFRSLASTTARSSPPVSPFLGSTAFEPRP